MWAKSIRVEKNDWIELSRERKKKETERKEGGQHSLKKEEEEEKEKKRRGGEGVDELIKAHLNLLILRLGRN